MIKKVLQQVLPKQAWAHVSWYRDRFGTAGAVAELVRLSLNGAGEASIRTPAGHQIKVRPGTADVTVFDEIFLHRGYEQNFKVPPKVIIDAGAHIGLATVYFAERYPDATIISLEPEPSNYALLVENTKQFPNVTPLAAALWGRDSSVTVTNPGADTWSFRFSEGDGTNAYGIQTLMKKFSLTEIDFLKIDIEGSEIEVLQSAAPWIGSVKAMLVELHDRYRPGCTEALHGAIATEDFAQANVGDCVMCSRPGVLNASTP